MSQLKSIEINIYSREWNIQKNSFEFGPFMFIEVVKMIKAGSLDLTDLVKNVNDADWTLLKDSFEFSTENQDLALKELSLKKTKQVKSLEFVASVLIIVNNKITPGESIWISTEGAAISYVGQSLEPQQKLKVHFKSGQGDFKAFNAESEVIRHQNQQLEVRFLNLKPEVQDYLKQLTLKKVA